MRESILTMPAEVSRLYAEYRNEGNLAIVAQNNKKTVEAIAQLFRKYQLRVRQVDLDWVAFQSGTAIEQIAQKRKVQVNTLRRAWNRHGYPIAIPQPVKRNPHSGKCYNISARLFSAFEALGLEAFRFALTQLETEPEFVPEGVGVNEEPLIKTFAAFTQEDSERLFALHRVASDYLGFDPGVSMVLRSVLERMILNSKDPQFQRPLDWVGRKLHPDKQPKQFSKHLGIEIPLWLHTQITQYAVDQGLQANKIGDFRGHNHQTDLLDVSRLIRRAVDRCDEATIDKYLVDRPIPKGRAGFRAAKFLRLAVTEEQKDRIIALRERFGERLTSYGDVVAAVTAQELSRLGLQHPEPEWEDWLTLCQTSSLQEAASKTGVSLLEFATRLENAGYLTITHLPKEKPATPPRIEPKEYVLHILRTGQSVPETAAHFKRGKTTVYSALEKMGIKGKLTEQLRRGDVPKCVKPYLDSDDLSSRQG